jgi:enoyl-CoA hydratase
MKLEVPFVIVTYGDGVATIQMDNEKEHNVLWLTALLELEAMLGRLRDDPAIDALVLTGKGRAFSVGASLNEIESGDSALCERIATAGERVFRILGSMPMPVVAAVNGLALGGGFELALACDIRWAHPRAIFAFPESQHGLFPVWGAVSKLRRDVPSAVVMELLLCGRRLSAKAAYDLGLINQVIDRDPFIGGVHEGIKTLRQKWKNLDRRLLQVVRKPQRRADCPSDVELFLELCREHSRLPATHFSHKP